MCVAMSAGERSKMLQKGEGYTDTQGEYTSMKLILQASCALIYDINCKKRGRPCPCVNQLLPDCQGQHSHVRSDTEETMPRKSLHNKDLSAARADSESLNSRYFPCECANPEMFKINRLEKSRIQTGAEKKMTQNSLYKCKKRPIKASSQHSMMPILFHSSC